MIGRSVFFLADRVFRGVMTSAAYVHLLDRVSHHEHPGAGTGADRPAAQVPDLGYHPAIHESTLIPLAAPRDVRAWRVQWKAVPHSPVNALGYQSVDRKSVV